MRHPTGLVVDVVAGRPVRSAQHDLRTVRMNDSSADVRPRPSLTEIVGAVGALALQLFLAFGFYGFVIILSMASDQCAGHTCNYVMFGFSIYLIPIGELAILVLSIVLMVRFSRQDRPLWAPAVVGCCTLLLLFVVAWILNWGSVQDWGPLP
jgi:hypothetical protein